MLRLTLVAALLLAAPAAHAAAPAFGKTDLDYFRGPLVNDGRIIGLGGAYTSIAEGAAGQTINPAATAIRPSAFANDWFDWDLCFAAVNVVGGSNDLDMSGNQVEGDKSDAKLLGLNLKFGRFAVGFHFTGLDHTLIIRPPAEEGAPAETWELSQAYGGVPIAWAFDGGQWVVGTTIAVAQATIKSPRPGDPLVSYSTEFHPSTFGVRWAPTGQRFRAGVSYRLPQVMLQRYHSANEGKAVSKLGNREVPRSVRMAGQLRLGASYQLGERQTNIRPSYGARPRPTGSIDLSTLRRPYLLVAADLVFTGSVTDGVGARAFLDNELQESGRSWDLGAHLGAEAEVLPNRLQVRTGSYFEPSRFDTRVGRLHWTAGADVRVTLLMDWRIGAVIDLAGGYTNLTFGVGLWH